MTRPHAAPAMILPALAVLGLALGALVPTAQAADPPSPEAIIEAFEGVVGPIRTHRPSHPKGTCAAGFFVGTAEGSRLSVAPVFNGQSVPVIIRLGVAGANPRASDTSRGTRGLSIRFELPNGDQWDMANISAPIFGSPTPEVFVESLLVRRADPATGQPNAAAIAAFVAANPATTLQGRWLAANNPPASVATTPYFGVNAFRFRGADGQVRHARWVFEPVAGVQRLTEEEMRTLPASFLADEARRRIATAPIQFDMVLQFPSVGDDLLNPTIAWPEDRPRVTVGRLSVTEIAAGEGGPCDPISFLNLDLPPGVELSEDPTLHVRASSYAVALSRRLQ